MVDPVPFGAAGRDTGGTFRRAELSVGAAFLANGVAAFVAAPPPADAFPYQDLTHLFSMTAGALAAVTTWREMRRTLPGWSFIWGGTAVVLMVGLFSTQALLSAANV